MKDHIGQLKKNCSFISNQLTSGVRSGKMRFSSDEVLRVRAFAIVFHAEIEQYFENIAAEVISRAEKDIRNKRRGSTITTALQIHYFKEPGAGESIEKIVSFDFIARRAFWAIGRHRSTISSNNGIKEENISRIFRPIGYDIQNISQLLVAECDALGSIRGRCAHTSLQNAIGGGDVSLILSKPALIIPELERFDASVREFANNRY